MLPRQTATKSVIERYLIDDFVTFCAACKFNGLLKGVSGLSTTDEYGLFQAEVMINITRIDFETQTGGCHIELPKYTALQGVASIGVLTCRLQKKDME